MDTLTGMKRTDYCGNFTTEQIDEGIKFLDDKIQALEKQLKEEESAKEAVL